jgi:Ssl1-like
MKLVAYKLPLKILWQEVEDAGHLFFHSLHNQIHSYLSLNYFRLLAPASAIRRTIIRHLILVLDLSSSMTDRDMRPTRFDLMLQYAREFILEWFDQNPLGQIGVVGMRAGFGERVGEMSGNL